MAIISKASAKAAFEKGDRPSQSDFVDLIDSTYSGEIGAAIVSAAAVSAGIIKIASASGVTILDSATAGEALLGAGTVASARTVLEAGSAGQAVWLAGTQASARTAIGAASTSAATATSAGIIEIATTAEAVAGTNATLAMTPATEAAANLASSALVLLDSGSVANALSLDITALPTGYRSFRLEFDTVVPVTNDVNWLIRTTADDITFDAGASNYGYHAVGGSENVGTVGGAGSSTATSIRMNTIAGQRNNILDSGSGWIEVVNPLETTTETRIRWMIEYDDASNLFGHSIGAGKRKSAAAVTGFQFILETGNILTMNWTLYGVRA